MGLAVVHGIVRSHHGRITVESSQGCGATFDVYLPLIERDECVK
jgi:signal transduction histidine kinase